MDARTPLRLIVWLIAAHLVLAGLSVGIAALLPGAGLLAGLLMWVAIAAFVATIPAALAFGIPANRQRRRALPQ